MIRLAAVALAFAACGPKPAGRLISDPPVAPLTQTGVCRHWKPMEVAGSIAETALNELSGLAASVAHPGVLYAHNDSGDTARFFAMSTTGAALGQLVLAGATADDWEDVAVGPCPTGTCVYLGDIGDNTFVRTNLAVYRVAEPNVAGGRPPDTVSVPFERFAFQYPGGARYNAETLLVHPVTGGMYVITKLQPSGAKCEVYRFPQPLDAGSVATLVKVADFLVPTDSGSLLTGGSIDPTGRSILVRQYAQVAQLLPEPGAAFETMFTGMATIAPSSTDEGQGEAIAFAADGRSYYTASEGQQQKLHVSRCDE